METYISILRGINVSGQKLIKMEKLREAYSDLGFADVNSYIQSGNVIFKTGPTDSRALEERIRNRISKVFGFEVPVLVKEMKEVETVIFNNPFIKDKNKDIGFLHITFLSESPHQDDLDKLSTHNYTPDEFILIEKEVYLYCPNGYGKTKLNNNFFESKLKVNATTRNWKTINELYRIACNIE